MNNMYPLNFITSLYQSLTTHREFVKFFGFQLFFGSQAKEVWEIQF